MNDEAIKIDVEKLSERWDPFRSFIWTKLKTPLKKSEIRRAVEKNYLISPDTPKKFYFIWDLSSRKSHIGRVAWFVVNYDKVQPIQIDFGIPTIGCDFTFIDGNHRYAAAIYRKEPFILAECSGAVNEINSYVFGEK